MEWLIVLPIFIFIILFLGGTVRILMSDLAPLRTRLRWTLVSVAPLVFMVLIMVIFSPSGSGGQEDELGLVGGMLTFMLSIAVIAANWMTFSTYRSSLS